MNNQIIGRLVCVSAIVFTMAVSAPAGEVQQTEAGQDALVRQNLRIAKVNGMSVVGETARFSGNFLQVTNEPVVMEAEFISSPGASEIGFDPTASSGGYATHLLWSMWWFTLKTPGRYTLWTRASFPVEGSRSHTEGIDVTPIETVKDPDGATVPGQWKWVKGRTCELKAGTHHVGLNHQGAAANLDLLVLAPDGEKEPDLATLKSSYSGPSSSELWTVPVKPFDVANWNSVHFDVQLNGGSAVYEISTDRGTNWFPVAADGSLSKVPVLGKGHDSVMFHAVFKAADPTRPAMFGGARVSYKPGPQNIRTVENSRLRMEIDPLGVKSLFDKKTGQFLINASKEHGSLLTLSCKMPGKVDKPDVCDLNTSLADDMQVSSPVADTKLMTLRHSLGNGMKSTTTALLKPDGQIEWKLGVDNPTKLEIVEVMFPLFSGCRIGEDGKDDWFFIPKCWGQTIQNPETLPTGGFWGPAMRWTMIWDKSAGLYLGMDNYKRDDYGFTYGSAPGTSNLTLAANFRTLGKPGATWTGETVRVAVTGPDWHEGADVYRATVGKSLKPCDVAPHVKWLLDVWNYQLADLFPSRGWDTVRQSFDSQESFGTHMAANRQMLDGSDACWNGYFLYPTPAWGTTNEFAQQLEALRNKGGFYMPYLNYRLFTGRYCSLPRLFTYAKSRLPRDIPKPDAEWYAKAATRRWNGKTECGTAFFNDDPMAIASREWRDWLAYWTRQYRHFGTDGMYYDQFNMIYGNGWLYEDYPDSYGSWANGVLDSFSKIKDESKKENPYWASVGEFCNDVYGQRLDLHMVSGVFNSLEFFRYTIPDQILLDGSWNGGFGHGGGWERERFIWQIGARFQEMAGNVPNDPDRKWVASILKLRRAVKSLIYDATFKDTAALSLDDASGKALTLGETNLVKDWSTMVAWAVEWRPAQIRGVSARWFLFKKDGQSGAVVNCINAIPTGDATNLMFAQKADAFVTVSTKEIGPITSAWAWLLDGSVGAVDGKQKGDAYSFKVPASELSSVVLSHSLRPVVEWSFDNVTACGATRQFKIKVTNVNASQLKGKAVLDLHKSWKAPDAVSFGPLESGKSVELSIPVTVPKDATLGRHDVWCHVKTKAGDFAAYHFAVVNQPVLVEFMGNPGTYQLRFRNLTEAPFSASVKLSAPTPLKAECAGQIAIPPTNTVTLPVTVTGQDQLREISEMSAEISIGQVSKRLVRAVMPTVPNGDFEMDTAGDLKPDWWMCRTDRDSFAYDKMNLSTNAHGGKYCLRLDPPAKDQQFIYAFPENYCMKAGAIVKYRISCWIKSKATEGVYVGLGENFKLGNGKTSDEWQEFSVEQRIYSGAVGVRWMLINKSSEPAFFDDFKVEEL